MASETESGVPEIPKGLNQVRAIRADSASVAVRIDARLVRLGSPPSPLEGEGMRMRGKAIYPSQYPFRQHHLDMPDGARGIQAFGADLGAIHDGMATEKFIRIFEVVQTLAGGLIAAVRQKPQGLEQSRRPQKFVRIPPERRARSGATGAQDALV